MNPLCWLLILLSPTPEPLEVSVQPLISYPDFAQPRCRLGAGSAAAMAADERVHKKTHFGPLPDAVQPATNRKEAPASSAAPAVALAAQAAQANGQDQPQSVFSSEQSDMAFRRDIYSIHGEQVGQLTYSCSTGNGRRNGRACCQLLGRIKNQFASSLVPWPGESCAA